jgi:hypothetical protein
VVSGPAAADASIDQFCEALHELPYCFHVFAITLFVTNRWRKQLLKGTDINFVVKPWTEIWGASQYEHLGVFNSLPLCSHEPWYLRGTHQAVDLAIAMCALQKSDTFIKGIFCANFFSSQGNWTQCQKVWCGECFQPLKGDRFLVRLPKYEEGKLLVNEEDRTRLGVERQ